MTGYMKKFIVRCRPTGTLLLAGLSAIALLGFFTGCGDSGSNDASQAQIEAAKTAGEEHALEKERVDDLQKQVRHLRRQVQHGDKGVAVVKSSPGGTETGVSANTVLRTFHTESGNVTCEILSDGARCFVAPTGTTFAFSGGGPGRIESAASVAPGSGEVEPYGASVSAGAITCTIPPSSSPHGVTCTDSESGHGFEASRVAERQHGY
jgi:hypothetical protein